MATMAGMAAVVIAPEVAAQQLEHPHEPVSFAPNAKATARMGLWDTTARSDITYATTDVRFGGSAQYRLWTLKVEVEATGPSDDGDSVHERTQVRQAYLQRRFGVGDISIGRMLPGTAFTGGLYFSHNSIEDEYGSSDGLRAAYERPLGGRNRVRASLAFVNTLGSTPVTDMQAGGPVFPNFYEPAYSDASKQGGGWIGEVDASYAGVDFALWYGSERNRFGKAATAASTPEAPDGAVYAKYDDLQGMVSYGLDDWKVHGAYRSTKRTKTLKGMVERDGHVASSADGSPRDDQERHMANLGGTYTWMRTSEAEWTAGVDIIQASTATDNLTKPAQSIEDENDTLLYALSQAYREGPFEVALNFYYAKAKGRVFQDDDGRQGTKDARTMAFLRVGVELGEIRVASVASAPPPPPAVVPPLETVVVEPPPPPVVVAEPTPVPPPVVVPPPAKPAPVTKTSFGSDRIRFAPSSTNLSPESVEYLKTVGKRLRANMGMWGKVDIVGHSDATGPIETNILLSERRAMSVRDALIAGGVPRARIMVRGIGADELLQNVPFDAPEQRRVDLRFEGAKSRGFLNSVFAP